MRKLCETHQENIMDKSFILRGPTAYIKHFQHYSPNSIGDALRIAVSFSFSFDLDTSVITYLAFSLL